MLFNYDKINMNDLWPTVEDTHVGNGEKWKPARMTCKEMDRRHPDVLWSRHQRCDDDDESQRQMENIRGESLRS